MIKGMKFVSPTTIINPTNVQVIDVNKSIHLI